MVGASEFRLENEAECLLRGGKKGFGEKGESDSVRDEDGATIQIGYYHVQLKLKNCNRSQKNFLQITCKSHRQFNSSLSSFFSFRFTH